MTMTALRLNDTEGRRALIDDAIAQNGAMRVLIAAIRAVFRDRRGRRARPPDAHSLNAHMRRDIGLYPEPESVDWQRYLP